MITYIKNISIQYILPIGGVYLVQDELVPLHTEDLYSAFGSQLYFYLGEGPSNHIGLYDENEDQITVFDSNFWQSLLEIVATKGELAKALPPNGIYNSIVDDDIDTILRIDDSLSPLDEWPKLLTFRTTSPANKVVCNHDTELAFSNLPSISVKRENDSSLEHDDLTAESETFQALLDTFRGFNYYRILGKLPDSSGGNVTTPVELEQGWSETVSNRAAVVSTIGYTYRHSESKLNPEAGATASAGGIGNGELSPLMTGRGRTLTQIRIAAAYGAIDGGTKESDTYINVRLYSLNKSAWIPMNGTYSCKVFQSSEPQINIHNNLGSIGSGSPIKAGISNINVPLEDNRLYGVVFVPSNNALFVNALSGYTITLSGDQN